MKFKEKKRQSPVNLMTDSARKENFSPLNFSDYSKFINALMEIKNNGHTGIRTRYILIIPVIILIILICYLPNS